VVSVHEKVPPAGSPSESRVSEKASSAEGRLICSLNFTVTPLPGAIPVAPSAGVKEVTVGGVTSTGLGLGLAVGLGVGLGLAPSAQARKP
jgi:hypothetical protein